MARRTVGLIRNGKYYDIAAGEVPPPSVVKYGEAPAIWGDEMRKTYCDATGEYYESRSEMRRALRESNCEPCDHSTRFKRDTKDNTREWEETVAKAYNDLRNGNTTLSDEDRAICGEIDGRDK